MASEGVFPKNYDITSNNPDEFLLNTWFDAGLNQLFILWYNNKDKTKRLQIEADPQVPIFISKTPKRYNEEHIARNLTNRVMVPYITKSDAIKEELFDYSVQRFRTPDGQLVQKLYIKDLPNKGEYLHPNLYGGDITIEEWVYMDWALKHYEKQGDYVFEKYDLPNDLAFASFDIETIEDPDGIWRIHTNTFIDEKSHTAYLDYWHREDFAKVDFLTTNTKDFIDIVKKTLNDAIENSTIKDKKKRANVQKVCHEIADNLNYKIRRFDSEEDLIRATTRTMFTEYSPDILMAFNTTYDLGMFMERIDRLGLPQGLLNEQGIGYDHERPSFASKWQGNLGYKFDNLDENYQFKGDQINPQTRKVRLNNISHTVIGDLQICYWSFRNYMNPPSFSLNYTAESVLGFGKFDYSHICNHITKLARADYVWHSVYALIDSILLLMINKVGREFTSREAFCITTKTTMSESAASSSAIPSSFNADAVDLGYIPGSNINKILKSMSIKHAEDVSRVLNTPAYVELARDLKRKQEFGGGLVSDPNNWIIRPDMMHMYNVLSKECQYALNMKILDVCYLDYKSHYPFQRITRNISKLTLMGRITGLIDGPTDLLLLDTTVKKTEPNYIEHMGGINLALANHDIITYGSMVHDLPNLTELVSEFIPFDSKPVMEYIDPEVQFELDIPKPYKPLMSVLTQCNTKKISSVEKDKEVVVPDNKYFLLNSGACTYYNTLIEFRYSDMDIYKVITGKEFDDILYGTPYKDKVIVDNHLVSRPLQEKHEFSSKAKWIDFPVELIKQIADATLFTTRIKLDGKTLHVLNKNFFFPFKYYLTKLDDMINDEKIIKKKVVIDALQYRVDKLESTFHVEFKYRVQFKDIKLWISQTFQCVDLDKHEDEGDILI